MRRFVEGADRGQTTLLCFGVPASVSKTCLVRFDNNKYSVAASAVGRPVEVYSYADRIVIRQDGRIVGLAQGQPARVLGERRRDLRWSVI